MTSNANGGITILEKWQSLLHGVNGASHRRYPRHAVSAVKVERFYRWWMALPSG